MFLGLLLRMTLQPLPNITWHWNWPAHLPRSLQHFADFKTYMAHAVFKVYWEKLLAPGFMDPIPDDASPPAALKDIALDLVAHFSATWQGAWTAGTYLVPDESMIFWTGAGEVHMTYLKRKPTPFGIMLKTMCDGDSRICVAAEVCESKEAMATKEYRDVTGATTACTLRLTKPWAGTGRTVVADSWFGSCNTAEFLMDVHGLHSVMSVKNGSGGYPKAAIREALGGVRHRSAFFKVEVQLDSGVRTFYAGGHQDRKPLHLIATCGTSLPGPERTRYRRDMEAGAIVRQTYTLQQPLMHSIYRQYFNAVDMFNREALGPQSVQYAVRTRSYFRRLFLALLGMSEGNAMLAYRKTVKNVTRYEWLCQLSTKLIHNPWVVEQAQGLAGPVGDAGSVFAEHGKLLYREHHGSCVRCQQSTHWKCGCDLWLCNAGTSKRQERGPCYSQHLFEVFCQAGNP